jgi:hypothetical protein
VSGDLISSPTPARGSMRSRGVGLGVCESGGETAGVVVHVADHGPAFPFGFVEAPVILVSFHQSECRLDWDVVLELAEQSFSRVNLI